LAKLEHHEILAVIAIVMGSLIAIVSVIAIQWRCVRVAEMEATLKQQMLDKGMSPADIDQVMNAGKTPSAWQCPPATTTTTGDEAMDRAALVQRMVDNGYEGEDIERVLKAYQVKQPAGAAQS
jgi:hypothetical protein